VTAAAPDLRDVQRAASSLRGRVHRTPLLSSRTLSARAGAPVWLKAELLQRTGSFKPRGVFTKLDTLTSEERRRGVISISAGNHAQALAYACAQEGIDCLVVMWEGASPLKLAAARGYGATVDLESPDTDAAFGRLAELRETTGRTLVHPFDDEHVIAGQGTVGLEIVEELPEVEAILVPVGGGGLLAGVAIAANGVRPGVRVIAVEPEGSAAMHRSLAAREPRRHDEGSSIADGLVCPLVGERCFAVASDLAAGSVTVTDKEIAEGFRFLYERAKLAAEPAGAAATGALLAGKVDVSSAAAVAVVVSGGNVAPEKASAILAEARPGPSPLDPTSGDED
jgi:threonine dehydratase